MDDVFDMPQVRALGIVQSIPHPTAGRVKVPGMIDLTLIWQSLYICIFAFCLRLGPNV